MPEKYIDINFFDDYETVLKKLGLSDDYETINLLKDKKNIVFSEPIGSVENVKEIAASSKVKYKFLDSTDLIRRLNDKYHLTVEKDKQKLKKRQLVVTIMGHIDHGKTTLLDKIRSTSVTSGEYGSITQKLGAYQVKKQINGVDHIVSFIDTPGHELFEDMRRRGIAITDIAILLIDANVGVEKQTVEAIEQIKNTNVSIIVAFNKIDKGREKIPQIKNQLVSHGILTQEHGGDAICVEVSAKTGDGIDELLESLVLLDEAVLDVKGDVTMPGFGVVMESHIEHGLGIVATVLLQKGAISIGNYIVSHTDISKVRKLFLIEAKLISVNTASIYQPIQIIGLSKLPEVNSTIKVFSNQKEANNYLEEFIYIRNKEQNIGQSAKRAEKKSTFLDNLPLSQTREMKLYIKADASGILESIKEVVYKLKMPEDVKVNIIYSGIGEVTQSDLEAIATTNSTLILFNLKPNKRTETLLVQNKTPFFVFRQLYELLDKIKDIGKDLSLKGKNLSNHDGMAIIKKVFSHEKERYLIGCQLVEGAVNLKNRVELVFDNGKTYQIKLVSLRSYKQKVNSINEKGEFGAVVSIFKKHEEAVEPKEGGKLYFFKRQ